ncbi:Inositol monophosphatase, involved in biosynthesis of inositol [Komagataella phaffii GS115]|uniref:Inositol-1-monophosphatase n=1 Tax=Komagataella phaffii (strain GS115 / ATCC 20864) TaxID=644223 RepID=C4R8R7_KOMPG|nr:Inositol monophosphatase, involved in biosynthesis of inositol [Komagataella phaffii GS115]CAY71992.1 Inositol monophosphatase, involved in biosynthesis of inositol [Komagataella phaffii GS115]
MSVSKEINHDINLDRVLEVLTRVAKEAGAIIKKRNGTTTFDNKKNSVDLVTEVDQQVEDFIKKELLEEFPDFEFFGEESFVPGSRVPLGPTFIVDPIDGTLNFIHEFPFSCTSLGFSINRKPMVGVVYNPHLDLLFTGIRAYGSAAMNLCYMATGAIDGYWENHNSWDCCAAWVLLEETGGIVIHGNNGKYGEPVDVDVNCYFYVRGAPEEDQKKFITSFQEHITGELQGPEIH